METLPYARSSCYYVSFKSERLGASSTIRHPLPAGATRCRMSSTLRPHEPPESGLPRDPELAPISSGGSLSRDAQGCYLVGSGARKDGARQGRANGRAGGSLKFESRMTMHSLPNLSGEKKAKLHPRQSRNCQGTIGWSNPRLANHAVLELMVRAARAGKRKLAGKRASGQ